ncbi:hypothetical protein LMG28688_05264 [Paraburkholderia caffeinitolerans]|uniref:Uncharacterized protein n=1 Tax=Paraburkholderia caffeinitolerans TaxID=1723730 RepID=A0A6J5GHA5_9BURK|nr:hypothetical protein [Paraburkholderia caffeinitolerans]CAB3800865.1 hypothetical protein LMG28688_05264 [Paraburkholderia caffeinitolerans]
MATPLAGAPSFYRLGDRMFEAFAMSIIAVTAGASLTFLCALLMPDAFAQKSAANGPFAGLGDAPARQRVARTRHSRRVRRAGHALP